MTKTIRMRMVDSAAAFHGWNTNMNVRSAKEWDRLPACDGAGAPLRTLIGEFPEPGLRTERDENGALRIIRDDGSLAATFPGSSIVAEQEDDALRVYLMTTEPIATGALGDAARRPMTPARLQTENSRRHARVGDHSSEVEAAVSSARKAPQGFGPEAMQHLNERMFPRVSGTSR